MGYGVEAMKYRFQWNFPIVFSPHDPKTLYIGANVLLKTTNEGQSWEADQPRSDAQRQVEDGHFGRPHHAGQHQRRVLLHDLHVHGIAGDEGRDLDRVGRRAGAPDARRRQDVGRTSRRRTCRSGSRSTPSRLRRTTPARPTWRPPCTSQDDFRPYLYKTTDYGKTWKKIVNGIPANRRSRAWCARIPIARACWSPARSSGCIFRSTTARTGSRSSSTCRSRRSPTWPFQSARRNWWSATQGRSFWVLDDLPLLYQLNDAVTRRPTMRSLFQPKDTYRFGAGGGRGGGGRGGGAVGQNPPAGAVVDFWLKEQAAGRGDAGISRRLRQAREEVLEQGDAAPAGRAGG